MYYFLLIESVLSERGCTAQDQEMFWYAQPKKSAQCVHPEAYTEPQTQQAIKNSNYAFNMACCNGGGGRFKYTEWTTFRFWISKNPRIPKCF